MLPMRDGSRRPGYRDDLDAISAGLSRDTLGAAVATWDLESYRALVSGSGAWLPAVGTSLALEGGDTVTNAPELVRTTLNLAAAHLDPASGGRHRRLVYGGHTIGLALAHVTRALPDLVTVVGWRSCNHLAPVFEGDVLHSTVKVEAVDPLKRGALLVDLRVQTNAQRSEGRDRPPKREPVLDWRLVAVAA